MATRIAVELSDSELQELDDAVARGSFKSREEAMQAALASFLGRSDEAEIADAYRRAYADEPEDERLGDLGLRLAAERLREID